MTESLKARPRLPGGGYALGYRPDLTDVRDFIHRPTLEADLPATVRLDLDAAMPPPYDQLRLGSCTANALAGAMEFDLRSQGSVPFTPSRLFIYFNERFIEGSTAVDGGAFLRDGCQSLSKAGAPPETAWPYDVARFADQPPPEVYATATASLVTRYERVTGTADDMRRVLAAGRPFAFGCTVYDSFFHPAPGGFIPMPGQTDAVAGGHAMLACGYAELSSGAGQAPSSWVRVRNSWGKDWGDGGYCWMPQDYLDGPLTSDAWVIYSVAGSPAG